MATNEKKEFADRLNRALDIANIPPKGKGRQLKLASLLNVSQESVRKWLSGESFPDTNRIFEIANKLNVNIQWLLSGIGKITQSVKIKELPIENSVTWTKVPILTWEEAGRWDKVIKTIHEKESIEYAWAEPGIGENSYALIVKDDSMVPRYEKDSILIIDPDYKPSHKHIVVYLLEGEKDAICKQLLIDGKHKYLKPHNPSYPASHIGDKDKYCGAIRQARMRY